MSRRVGTEGMPAGQVNQPFQSCRPAGVVFLAAQYLATRQHRKSRKRVLQPLPPHLSTHWLKRGTRPRFVCRGGSSVVVPVRCWRHRLTKAILCTEATDGRRGSIGRACTVICGSAARKLWRCPRTSRDMGREGGHPRREVRKVKILILAAAGVQEVQGSFS